MSIEQRASEAEADVKIRTPTYGWMQSMVMGAFFLALSAQSLVASTNVEGTDRSADGTFWLILGFVAVAQSLWLRTWGVDLTPESARLRGIRRQSVAWSEVQAVVRCGVLGAGSVQLILDDGRPILLRGPTRQWGLGKDAYERDFDRIGQWWLVHRGESWRPVRTDATRTSAQG